MAKFERKFDVNSFLAMPNIDLSDPSILCENLENWQFWVQKYLPNVSGGGHVEIWKFPKFPNIGRLLKCLRCMRNPFFCYGKVKWDQMKCFLATCLFSQKMAQSETSTIWAMMDICQHLTFLTLHLLESEVYQIFFWKSILEQISQSFIIYDLVEVCNLFDPKNVWSSKNPFPRWFWMGVKMKKNIAWP